MHVLLAQHGCPAPPHAPQLPFMQTAPRHIWPAAVQVPPAQQPPFGQLLAGQQGWPGAPQESRSGGMTMWEASSKEAERSSPTTMGPLLPQAARRDTRRSERFFTIDLNASR